MAIKRISLFKNLQVTKDVVEEGGKSNTEEGIEDDSCDKFLSCYHVSPNNFHRTGC